MENCSWLNGAYASLETTTEEERENAETEDDWSLVFTTSNGQVITAPAVPPSLEIHQFTGDKLSNNSFPELLFNNYPVGLSTPPFEV